VINLSNIYWGIDNLTEKCAKKYNISNESLSIEEKLNRIQVNFAIISLQISIFINFKNQGLYS
jgi:hypothetical protein